MSEKPITGPYRAVTASELVAMFGPRCSPMRGKDGYMIGPVGGRIAHLASCFTLRDAQERADKANARHAAEQSARGE